MSNNTELDLQCFDFVFEQNKDTNSSKRKFAEVSKSFKCVVADLYSNKEEEFLWRLEKDAETGEEFLVRTIEANDDYRKPNGWNVIANKNKDKLNVIYNGFVVKAFDQQQLNFTEENIDEWRDYLLDKIDNDPTFISQITSSISEERKAFLK